MKKCASCTKDLPEAALHCVFCGAKQPQVPAVQGGLAKTAFGYSASELEQMKPPARPQPGSQPPPHLQATLAQPASFGSGGGAGVAATLLAPQGLAPPPPPPRHQPSSQPPPYPSPTGGMGIHSPRQFTPAPLPAVTDPYLTTPQRGPRRAGIEPWQHSLRIVMFLWGALTLISFATPLAIDPLAFNWDLIIHGEGSIKVMPLLVAAVGVLSILLAAIPMPAAARGVLAAVLGLSGVVVPIAMVGELPPWQILVALAGVVVLVPGLLARAEYVDSLAARVIVTLGVLSALALVLMPSGGEIPLVQIVKSLIDAEGTAKVQPVLTLGAIALVVLALLVWLPGPATAGAKLIAWLIILWGTLITHVVGLIVAGDLGAHVKAAPNSALVAWVPGAAFLVLIGYGLATVIGKRLE